MEDVGIVRRRPEKEGVEVGVSDGGHTESRTMAGFVIVQTAQ